MAESTISQQSASSQSTGGQSTTLPAATLALDGLLVLAVVAMSLVVAETSFHLVGMRRQRRERLHQATKRSMNLQALAERAAPEMGGMTLFKASQTKSASSPGRAAVAVVPPSPVPVVSAVPVPDELRHDPLAPTIISQPAPTPAAPPAEVKKPSGFEPYKVVAIVDESPDVKSFRFAHVDGKPLSPFHPGQYLTIQTTPSGAEKPAIRCYSLSSAPHQNEFYQISVKAVEKGLISNHLHRTLKVGDTVELKKPGGKFFLDPAQRLDIGLIAGGIGITPCYSMAMEFLHTGRRNRIDLFYGCRTMDDVVYAKELQALAAKHENFRLHVVLSRAPDGGGWSGLTGRVDISLLRRVLLYNLRGRAYYLCGPSQMMTDITDALEAQGVPETDIHYEAFGPAAPKRKDPAPG